MSSHHAAGRPSEASGELGEPKAHRETALTITATSSPTRAEVTTTIGSTSPPVTVRIIRDGRVVHEFSEPAKPQALPANSNEPQGEAA